MSVLDFLHRAPIESAAPALPLAAALRELDIEPFEASAVEQYKKVKKEATFPAALIQPSCACCKANWLENAMATELARQFLKDHAFNPRKPMPTHFTFSVADPTGLGLAGLTCEEANLVLYAGHNGWDMRFYQDGNGRVPPQIVFLRWRRMSLVDAMCSPATEPPGYVAHKADQIREKVPDAKVEVEVLESRTHPYDPFLVVSLGEEEYYVEVWGGEEREFSR
jgi:hypothetical protein